MKKLALLLPLLVACSAKEPNLATVMVKAQAPNAACTEFPARNGISIAVCTIDGKQFVSVYSLVKPWQVFPLKDAEKPAQNPPPPQPDATPTPDAAVTP